MILVSDNIYLSALGTADAASIVQHLCHREISDNSTTIPFPYSLQDALHWLEDEQIFYDENGINRNLAIRTEEDMMIGTIGLHYNHGTEADKSEFGYWLAKPYWNRGIITAVIDKYCTVAKAQYQLKTLEAYTFAHNLASQRVLVKNAFLQKAFLPAHFKKDGRKIDAVKFVKQL